MQSTTATVAYLSVGLSLCVTTAAAQQVCDGRLPVRASPAAGFEDHGDGTLTDPRSGLMWMRCSTGQTWSAGTCVGEATARSWAAAREAAHEVNRLGAHFFNDWRVPQVHELATLAELACRNPRIDLAWFPNTPADAYWTASTRRSESAAADAFTISFGAEGVAPDDKSEAHFVRLVRNAR